MWSIGTRLPGNVHTPPRARPVRRRVRDLAGLAPVLGRFGPFEIKLAETKGEIRKAQRLRYAVFYEEGHAVPSRKAALVRRDLCPYDKVCDHLLVLDVEARNRFGHRKPKVVGTYRLLRGDVAEATLGFYSAREFDLAPLLERQRGTRVLELGRSCVHPRYRSKRAIELLWRGLWIYARHHRIEAMIGCASLPGTDPAALALPLSFLHHQAPASEGWCVLPHPGRGVDMGTLSPDAIDPRKAIAAMPPLLKAYLRVGARFGAGAVVDRQFGTTDVFTILRLADMEQRYIDYYGGPMEMPGGYVA
jgi:putative hemolysin